MGLLEYYRRKAEKWLIDGIWDAEIGDFDIWFRIGRTRHRFKAFSIPWLLTYLVTTIVCSWAIYWTLVMAIIIGG